MKKIPTLFKREFDEKTHKIIAIHDEVTKDNEWVLQGKGKATIKYDGSCVLVTPVGYYKRYDAKKGKPVPNGAIPCCEPDATTGHWPHWIPVSCDNPTDKWFVAALANYENDNGNQLPTPGTYEAIGVHFQGNPYNLDKDTLIKHGSVVVEVERSFEGIKRFLEEHYVEGLVFWKDGEPRCKIKRSDFGLPWNGKGLQKGGKQ